MALSFSAADPKGPRAPPESIPPKRIPRKITDTPEEKYRNLSYLFNYYLHQDWTIEGATLAEVFERNQALHELSKGIRREAEILLEKGHDNQYLDDIFFGRWSAGYEPEADGHETWNEVLREIIRFCDRYPEESERGVSAARPLEGEHPRAHGAHPT